MATDGASTRIENTENITLESYFTPTIDFLLILLFTVIVSLASVAVLIP